MFHILRFSDLSVLEMAPLRFSLPYIVSVLVNKQTSVNRFSYLFHIHTAVLLYRHTCTNAVIPLLAIVLVVTYQGTALLLLLFVVFVVVAVFKYGCNVRPMTKPHFITPPHCSNSLRLPIGSALIDASLELMAKEIIE